MEFVKFVGFCFAKFYELLDFKILGFNVSVIHIIVGCFVLGALINFFKNVSGCVGTLSTLYKTGVKGSTTINNYYRDYIPKHANKTTFENARHVKRGGN